MTSRSSPAPRRRRARPALGTLVDITLHEVDDRRADAAFAAAFEVVARIHRLMSAHDPASDIRRLSEAAHLRPLAVDAETVAVLRLALHLQQRSGGLFDIAVGGAMARDGWIPALADPARGGSDEGGNSGDILIGADGQVGFARPLHLDVGGIAKGHAVDRAVEALQALGIAAGLVNAGGDMRAFGGGSHAVQLRFAGGVRTVARIEDAALASSCTLRPGDADTARVPHVDPRCRIGGVGGIGTARSVVVQAPSAALADALTKVALLCPATADRVCAETGAEWREFDFHADADAATAVATAA